MIHRRRWSSFTFHLKIGADPPSCRTDHKTIDREIAERFPWSSAILWSRKCHLNQHNCQKNMKKSDQWWTDNIVSLLVISNCSPRAPSCYENVWQHKLEQRDERQMMNKWRSWNSFLWLTRWADHAVTFTKKNRKKTSTSTFFHLIFLSLSCPRVILTADQWAKPCRNRRSN